MFLFAERRLEGGVSAFAGQAAALPGTEAERQASTRGLEHTEVYPLLLFAVGGMMLFPAANDLLTMFVALEVLSLPLYLLCGLARRRRLLSQEAALKYFLLGAFSSGFFLYGVALIYGFAGSMEFAAINEAVRNDVGNQGLLFTGMGLLAVGLLFKVGAAPFQAWTPDVYQGAPTPVTAFMAAGTKVAAFGAILRLFYVAFGSDRWSWQPMMWVVAILTMVVGAVLALSQTDVKRLLAYSSVAHTGFLLTGVLGLQARGELAPGQVTSLQAVLFYLATYGFATLGAFAVVTLVRDSGRRGDRLEPVGGARQGGPDRRGRLRLLPARDGGHPADLGLRRQVGGLRGRPVRRCLAGRDRGGAVEHRGGVLLRPRDRAHVLLRARRAGPVGHPAVGPDRGHRRASAPPRPCFSVSCRARCSTWRPVRENSSGEQPLTSGRQPPCWRCPWATRRSRCACATGWRSSRPSWPDTSRAGRRTSPRRPRHLLAAGGKRFRPLLVLLAAEAGPDPDPQGVVDAACVVELTHIGSLYHDDVMDEAVLRRGADSANARWDNHVAILTGDFLFAKSSELTAGLGPEAVRIQARDVRPAGGGPDPGDRRSPAPVRTRSRTTSMSSPARPAR